MKKIILSVAVLSLLNLEAAENPNGEDKNVEVLFEGCGNLSEVNTPESVTEIETNAFNGCQALEETILQRPFSGNGPAIRSIWE